MHISRKVIVRALKSTTDFKNLLPLFLKNYSYLFIGFQNFQYFPTNTFRHENEPILLKNSRIPTIGRFGMIFK